MDNLLIEAEKFVVHLLNDKLDTSFLYHNISHTQLVVEKTKEIIEGMQINEFDAHRLLLAAWFHDVGYTKGIDRHEEKSIAIARAFLEDHNVAEKDVKIISDIILATVINYVPKNEFEKIIRDADSAHLGSNNFNDITELLRKEWELTCNKTLSESEWLEENIEFLTNKHKFYTDYALIKWEKSKAKNLARLLKSEKKLKQETNKLNHKKEELKFKKNKTSIPERGIDTMFRVTLRNHIALSDIADTKANILLSVNAIIVSLVLSNLLPKLDNPSNGYLIIPTIIFITFTIAAMILSVLATRPNVTSGQFTKKDVANKKVNLLFFGNFHKMKLNDFEWAINELMKDKEYLYNSLTKDLYFLGKVLNRKYKILRITYTIFIIGILVSVTAFAVAFQYIDA